MRRPKGAPLRRALFQLHRWVGIVAGVYIVVVCLTGAALVFRLEMQRAQHPALFTASAGPLADPVTVMEQVRAAYPQYRLSGVDAPTTTRPTYLAYVGANGKFLTVLIDPVTARVLGELPERSLVRTLQDLHATLLMGATGRLVNGVGACCLLLLCLTGLVIWWPGAARWHHAFTVDFTCDWRVVARDLHGAVAIWVVLPLAMWALTGFYFAFPAQFRAGVDWLSPVTSAPPPRPTADPVRSQSSLDWRVLVDAARAQRPGEYVARVVVPASTGAAIQVLFAAQSPTPAASMDLRSVYLDTASGTVLPEPPRGTRSTGDVIMAWAAPLHVGSFGGVGVKILWLLLGLAAPLLFVTGLIAWWTRVIRRKK